MREIKFRAWDTRNNEMHQVTDIAWELNDYETGAIQDVSVFMPYEFGPIRRNIVKWFELMQYTGLRDKSGKEIYEGDIVRMFDRPPSDDAWDLRVEWESGKFILTSLRDMGEYWGDLGDWFDCEWRVAMVGNIYENPELLKEKA
jgi:uncharacterized phage protein (TIGR01671 family)